MARVHSIQLSNGGVPKLPVPRGFIRAGGLEGDRQRDLEHHGGPDRALCLFSLELVTALQAEGHPITPGSTGENLTLEGIDWHTLTIGDALELESGARLAITSFAAPCRIIQASFQDRRFGRIGHTQHPGWSRLYARVEKEGEVWAGCAVTRLNRVLRTFA